VDQRYMGLAFIHTSPYTANGRWRPAGDPPANGRWRPAGAGDPFANVRWAGHANGGWAVSGNGPNGRWSSLHEAWGRG
jgi:hypothetical protein